MNKKLVAAVFLFLASMSFYLYGAYPSVAPGDSGEFIAAGYSLGIPHAPGYPTYVVLAKSFQQAIPWGNIAYRTNLFSAVCAAASVLLVFFMLIELAMSFSLSLAGALIFALGHAQIMNAQTTEVFALHTAFCLSILLSAKCGHWLLASFLSGAALGNHQTAMLIFPALGYLWLQDLRAERAPLRSLLIGFLTGLSIYLFLIIRADQAPVINSGNPNTLERWWRVVTRADYGSLTLALGDSPARTLPLTWKQLLRFGQGLADQITVVGMICALGGAAWGMLRKDPPTLAIVVAFVLVGPFFYVLGNLPFDAQSLGLLQRFFIVPSALALLLAAIGIRELFVQRQRFGYVVFAIPILLLARQVQGFPFRADFSAYAYGMNNLHSLPPHSIFIMDGGDDTFYTLAYLRHVEHKRQDIRLHDRGGVVYPGFYGDDFRRLTRDAKETRRKHVEGSFAATAEPMLFSTMNEKILPDETFVQSGILYGRKSLVSQDPWSLYDLRNVLPWSEAAVIDRKDYRTRALIPYYAYQRSVHAARALNWSETLLFASIAQKIGPDVVWLVPNLTRNAYEWAQSALRTNQLETAERFYRLITLWDARDPIAWSDLGAVQERRQDLDAAMESYRRAIQIDPTSEPAHFNLAVAYWKRSDWTHVVEEFRKVLEINPSNAAARNYLERAELALRAPR